MQRITPFLWFDNKAEEAANFYVSVFSSAFRSAAVGESKILNMSRFGDSGPGPKGSVMSVSFKIEGQELFALNGGPHFSFTPAISLFVNCETQEEVDELWDKLSAGGEKGQCGWLKDKFGLSWQIVPSALGKMLADRNPVKSANVVKAMLQMKKLEIKVLEQAYNS